MPSITVSQELFDRIWSLKRAGEKSESESLERVIGPSSPDGEGRLRDYEKADQDIQSTN